MKFTNNPASMSQGKSKNFLVNTDTNEHRMKHPLVEQRRKYIRPSFWWLPL